MPSKTLSRSQIMKMRQLAGFPARLRFAMDELELTQLELAARCSIQQAAISKALRGEVKNPGVENALQFAQAVGCTVEDLFDTEAVA